MMAVTKHPALEECIKALLRDTKFTKLWEAHIVVEYTSENSWYDGYVHVRQAAAAALRKLGAEKVIRAMDHVSRDSAESSTGLSLWKEGEKTFADAIYGMAADVLTDVMLEGRGLKT